MIKYAFKDDPLTIKAAAKANPQKIGEALAHIAAAANGHLTPKAVVNEARNNRSVLHRHFEWDDAVAAESWRVDQARTLIRSIHVVSDDDDGVISAAPAFISISDKGGVSYRTLGEVLESADLQSKALAQAERDFEAYEKRFRAFEEVCSAIRDARTKIARRRAAIENRPHA